MPNSRQPGSPPSIPMIWILRSNRLFVSSTTSDFSSFKTDRSSTIGRPTKKPGERSSQELSSASHSGRGACGASAMAWNERLWKRIE